MENPRVLAVNISVVLDLSYIIGLIKTFNKGSQLDLRYRLYVPCFLTVLQTKTGDK